MPPALRSSSADPRRGRLARLGFGDPERAVGLLEPFPGADPFADEDLLAGLGAAADPDLALRGLATLVERQPDGGVELLGALRTDPLLRARLLLVLGASVALGETLARQPSVWRELADPAPPAEPRAELLRAVGADAGDDVPVGNADRATDLLRAAYHRLLLGIAARDLAGEADLVATSAALADLAGAALDAALAAARAGEPDQGRAARLAVIGMGKCGGRELNYVSDVDVIYVVEPAAGVEEAEALKVGTRLAQGLMRICMAPSPEGALWEVDAALRPEGKQGPLVRTLASHVAYYDRWAKTWEFQALLKARPVAGDAEVGTAYCAALWPRVWEAAARDGFVADVQAMRRRVEEHIPRAEQERQLKLGRGGLRDVEFAVQLLQLVHGRGDPGLRSRSTLAALAALGAEGYVGRDDAAALDEAYRFLRTLEHRIQMHRMRRTHLVPQDPEDLRRIGRSFGLAGDPADALVREWKRRRHEVRRIHEKLFYRPLLHAVAKLEPGEARLTASAARARLEALGYTDPAGALRHLEALTTGVSRRAAIQRTLLPVLLGWFADAADPDGGLLAFRRVSEALGETHWYLRDLRDEGAAAERMARVLGSSPYAADLLLRAPEAVAMLGVDGELVPRPRAALVEEALALVRRHDDPTAAAAGVRGLRRRELFRISAAHVLGLLDAEAVARALTVVAEVTLAGALAAAQAFVAGERRSPLPTRVAVIGMGRLGGEEMSYGSDADVLFVHEPLPGADERDATDAAFAVANELRRLLALPAPDPPLLVDADLRPEGRQGPLVRSLASYAAYYARWALVWERQALLRARPVAGDAQLGERFLELVAPLRWPAEGLEDADVREVRRIKARVEAERLPRGVDRARHLKLGPGGLSDVEWCVQLLQLQHAGQLEGLRSPQTLAPLAAAEQAGLVGAEDADALRTAWVLASRIRDAVVLVRGRAGDEVPKDLRELLGVARLVLGQGATPAALQEEQRRAARRARAAMERVFYG
ncbi:glutamate-ammonia-ligase adenylyltransferase [Motilibacter rhizosphaerae]|uniref:Bifunctional glutamine synthetase adenylyltransferase/adenylyl-removing enzyme n=1 Tax=Motilibacter rhizosphaerae TaxID=598652 RepID=A0A4Q7NRR8_9ACTN|nr:bifunctional [glutamine synthetase] adenylyltransferase/[glutamine synthetase]-adenylyl-L-tyrosine phosphorylase [Motilibacter rhizosphaerae]RZS89614.1 glutamate-ammonia-ligase adenylyltransferase [Motilibacter rhizosphaerae]